MRRQSLQKITRRNNELTSIGQWSEVSTPELWRAESKDGEEILSFALNAADGGYYFRVVRADKMQYMQVVQFPESARAKATKMKDHFFDSFRIVANAPAGQ